MCKKIKFDTEIRLFITLFLSSLEMPQKMLVFTKLTCAHKMWRCTRVIRFGIFLLLEVCLISKVSICA
jgi:hypothetical protein